jgi:hypothetical protein
LTAVIITVNDLCSSTKNEKISPLGDKEMEAIKEVSVMAAVPWGAIESC